MKKLWTLLLVLMLAAFTAACGTESAEEGSNGGQQDESPEEPAEDNETAEEVEEPAAEETDESADMPEESAEDTTEEEGTKMRLLEQQMTLSINGEETARTAFLQESEENNYSMYVAEGFTFTPEEPYVDQVFYDEDGAQYMRIYTYPKAESEAALIEEQMKGQADAIKGEAAGEWTPEESANEIIGGYETTLSEEQFKTYLYEKNDMYVRIAIYTKTDSDLEEAFLQMAETIE